MSNKHLLFLTEFVQLNNPRKIFDHYYLLLGRPNDRPPHIPFQVQIHQNTYLHPQEVYRLLHKYPEMVSAFLPHHVLYSDTALYS